ncbi:hypothetical protein [Aestuariivirga sp.]
MFTSNLSFTNSLSVSQTFDLDLLLDTAFVKAACQDLFAPVSFWDVDGV